MSVKQCARVLCGTARHLIARSPPCGLRETLRCAAKTLEHHSELFGESPTNFLQPRLVRSSEGRTTDAQIYRGVHATLRSGRLGELLPVIWRAIQALQLASPARGCGFSPWTLAIGHEKHREPRSGQHIVLSARRTILLSLCFEATVLCSPPSNDGRFAARFLSTQCDSNRRSTADSLLPFTPLNLGVLAKVSLCSLIPFL